MHTFNVILIGGGPANLMTASFLLKKGVKVALFEQNAQLGKKFLVAGKSGLNLSMDYTYDAFLEGYYRNKIFVDPILSAFTPIDQRRFFEQTLGIKTYVGSAGKVFPEISSVQVLKSWLLNLKQNGLEIFTHHKWLSGRNHEHKILNLKTNDTISIHSDFAVFGLGGNSWRETGSNANWEQVFKTLNIKVNAFQPSNSGLKCDFDDYIFEKWNGHFIKNTTITYQKRKFTGEIRIGKKQIEGSPVYHLNHFIRKSLERGEEVTIYIDFKPHWTAELIEKKWNPKYSISKNVKHLKLSPIFSGLYKNLNTDFEPHCLVKKFPIKILGFEEMDKAISTIGGVCISEIEANLSLKKQPNWFVNGEMIDWDAPTGGYLLSMCFALGHQISKQILIKY